MIYYFTPFCTEKRLGYIHNQYCALVPNDDDWVCLLDPDIMFLHPLQQAWIQLIIDSEGDKWDLLGCMTNRVGVKEQQYAGVMSENYDIKYNADICAEQWREERYIIEETDLIAGFFMLFKKSLWNRIKFEESIQFDMKFCNAVKKAGGRIGIMKGIYIFHNYRLNSNIKDKSHLLK